MYVCYTCLPSWTRGWWDKKGTGTGDEEAIRTNEGTSDFGWRSFVYVERGGHGGLADAKDNKETVNDEERWPSCGGHDDGSDEEEKVGDEDGGPAVESIVHPTTNCRPYNGPCHRHAHDALLFTRSLYPFHFKSNQTWHGFNSVWLKMSKTLKFGSHEILLFNIHSHY